MRDLIDLSEYRRKPIQFGRRVDWAIHIAIVLIGVLFIWMLQSLPQRATFFPWFITISILIVGTAYGIGKIRYPGKWDGQYDPETEGEHGAEIDTGPAYLVPYKTAILKAFVMFLGLVLFTMAMGSKISVPLFVAFMLWLNGENKIGAVVSGVAFWLAIHFIFFKAMSINLPTGYLTSALGF